MEITRKEKLIRLGLEKYDNDISNNLLNIIYEKFPCFKSDFNKKIVVDLLNKIQ